MIKTQDIRTLIEEEIEGSSTFIVDVTVSSGNAIQVFLDDDQGLPVKKCIQISRLVENSIDREKEDFELKVSSPGLDQPLKVSRQYVKNVGRKVSVKRTDGSKIEGLLTTSNEESIVIQTREKRRIEGRKAKEWVEEDHTILYKDILETKVMISFN